ncbi:hypothetical protein DFH09DRAFT_1372736 [Mycena vulgaris]|nr:hypothetical protein DFH09DRAFT_1372736 [Mycena vulgaris]
MLQRHTLPLLFPSTAPSTFHQNRLSSRIQHSCARLPLPLRPHDSYMHRRKGGAENPLLPSTHRDAYLRSLPESHNPPPTSTLLAAPLLLESKPLDPAPARLLPPLLLLSSLDPSDVARCVRHLPRPPLPPCAEPLSLLARCAREVGLSSNERFFQGAAGKLREQRSGPSPSHPRPSPTARAQGRCRPPRGGTLVHAAPLRSSPLLPPPSRAAPDPLQRTVHPSYPPHPIPARLPSTPRPARARALSSALRPILPALCHPPCPADSSPPLRTTTGTAPTRSATECRGCGARGCGCERGARGCEVVPLRAGVGFKLQG